MGKKVAGGALMLLAVVLASACGSKTEAPPGPGEARGMVPDLRGRTVLVYPVQIQPNVPQGVTPDAELAFALRSRGESVEWKFPEDIQGIIDRSPGVRVETRDLPVAMFLQAQVNRVGDPLFGELRRAAALAGSDVALIPVQVMYGADETYTISTAIINVRTGRVFWYGVVEGEMGPAHEPQTLASAADALARTLLPYR